MSGVINIKNLSFSYGDNKIFDKLDLSIKTKKWLTIIGKNGSGKSTLMKLIVNKYPYDGNISVDKQNKIGIVYNCSDLHFIVNTVDEELLLSKKNLDISSEEFNIRKEKIITSLNLSKLLNLKPNELSNSNKVLVSLTSILLSEPDILILDGTLEALDCFYKNKVIKILKYYYRRGMTIISVSHNAEDTLIGDDIMLLDSGSVILYENKTEFYKNEKILKKYGIELPFIVDLSLKLKYYNMVDKLYFNMEELVDAIWK